MLINYYTLAHSVRQLQELLIGSIISECYSQETGVFALQFERQKSILTLEVKCGNPLQYLLVRNNAALSKRRLQKLFDVLVGRTITSCSIANNDRRVHLNVGPYTVNIHLFGPGRSSVYLTKDGIVVDSFFTNSSCIGKELTARQQTVLRLDEHPPSTSLVTAIRKSLPLLESVYATQVCNQCGIDTTFPIGDLKPEKFLQLTKTILSVTSELTDSKTYRICRSQSGETLLTVIDVDEYPIVLSEYSSILEAVHAKAIQDLRDNALVTTKQAALTELQSKYNKFTKSLTHLLDDGSKAMAPTTYKHLADVLLSQQPTEATVNSDVVTITDWNNQVLEINVDSRKTLIENAQVYYEKSKKAATRQTVMVQRERLLRENIQQYKLKIDELTAITNYKELLEWLRKNSMKHTLSQNTTTKSDTTHYREFNLADGYVLYIGKNAANNDELTMKFAKQNDLWLHARGVSGSHAILRSASPKIASIPKPILQTAAQITAYYSSARNASYTPVCYTLRKNVRKPKGANVGAVILEREDVIMVKPSLPSEFTQFDT